MTTAQAMTIFLATSPTDLVGEWWEQGPATDVMVVADGTVFPYLRPGRGVLSHYRSGRWNLATDHDQYGPINERRILEAEAHALIARWGYPPPTDSRGSWQLL